jgi:hypothetical protein
MYAITNIITIMEIPIKSLFSYIFISFIKYENKKII